MQLLEWSDYRIRFKIKEIEDWISYDMDLTDFTDYVMELQFADDSILEIKWSIVSNTIAFDIYWEYTENKEWSFKADIWGIKWLKKVRFNPKTIKWKILDSVIVPEWIIDAE